MCVPGTYKPALVYALAHQDMKRLNRDIDQDLLFNLIDLFSIITNPEFDEIAYVYACVSVQSNNEQYSSVSQVE